MGYHPLAVPAKVTGRLAPQRISFRWEADADGMISLNAFLPVLNNLRSALYYTVRETETPSPELDVRLRLVHWGHAAKQRIFTAVAAASVSNGHPIPGVGRGLVENLGSFRSVQPSAGPPIRDMDALTAYRRLVEPVEKDVTRKVTITSGGRSIAITKKYVDQMVRVIGPDRRETGSVSGHLLKVNLYQNKRRFDIYPTIGPRRIACSFKPEDLENVGSSLNSYVTVEGILRFKHWDSLPYAVDVNKIRIHRQTGLPSLDDLHGLLPNTLGGMTAEEFVDSLRENDW